MHHPSDTTNTGATDTASVGDADIIPDLDDIFSTALDPDLMLDWSDNQLENLNLQSEAMNLRSEDLELSEDWLDKNIFSNLI